MEWYMKKNMGGKKGKEIRLDEKNIENEKVILKGMERRMIRSYERKGINIGWNWNRGGRNGGFEIEGLGWKKIYEDLICK